MGRSVWALAGAIVLAAVVVAAAILWINRPSLTERCRDLQSEIEASFDDAAEGGSLEPGIEAAAEMDRPG